MSKQKLGYSCRACNQFFPKWSGICPKCSEWNTLEEDVFIPVEKTRFESHRVTENRPELIHEIKASQKSRVQTKISVVDRLLGGGVVEGSLVLVGGDPGIGKSTLMLQLAEAFSAQDKTVLYISGEESKEQAALRALRLGIKTEKIYLFSETLFSEIKKAVESIKPELLIIDSVQIVYKGELPSLPGSVTQVKEIAMEAMHIAKGLKITTFLIGHVTKSGELAGPRVLEHIVDTVLDFEGDREHGYRILRSTKNRFGPTDEIALFQMGGKGLKEVLNPSEAFLKERIKDVAGSVIVPTMEGSSAFLVEVQALVAPANFSTSSRKSTGLDQNRLSLLLAVLEKRVGYAFQSVDVFVSVAGGMKIVEPAADLGILMAIASSFSKRSINSETVVIGEVGLTGEIRSVSRIESRLKEAIHMGFKYAVIPKKNSVGLPESITKNLTIFGAELVEEAIGQLLSRKGGTSTMQTKKVDYAGTTTTSSTS
ncbi:MAG: DNA repair protein RadA [Chlamydiae bacterium]|nr:DNA repair protein RadA [Chlamydiota bacterium]